MNESLLQILQRRPFCAQFVILFVQGFSFLVSCDFAESYNHRLRELVHRPAMATFLRTFRYDRISAQLAKGEGAHPLLLSSERMLLYLYIFPRWPSPLLSDHNIQKMPKIYFLYSLAVSEIQCGEHVNIFSDPDHWIRSPKLRIQIP
jgi:hypothetical protein